MATSKQPAQTHKLVPLEPTREMLIAGNDAVVGGAMHPYDIYKAMLSAAPAQSDTITQQRSIPLKAEPANRWIACSERLPGDGQQVWVAFEGYGQGYAIWQDEDWFFDFDSAGDLLSRKRAKEIGLIPATVTHWMNLPDAPATTNPGDGKTSTNR